MNTWNYRIIKTYCKETDEYIYGIHEVYYNEDGAPRSATEEPVRVIGESIDDLKWTLDKMKEAFEKPILEEKDFTSEED